MHDAKSHPDAATGAVTASVGEDAAPTRSPWRRVWGARRPRGTPYVAALLASATALLIALPLESLIESSSLLLFLAAVAISAWYGGLGPGLMATVAGGTANAYFFVVPVYSLEVANLTAAMQLVVFALVAVLTSSLSASLRQSRQREATARADIEAARLRARFLADASAALDASLDYEETLQTLARLVVPALADWCVVHVTIDEPDAVHRFTLADGDRADAPLLRTLRWQASTGRGCSQSLHAVLSTGRPVLHERFDEVRGTANHPTDWHLHLLETIGFRSVMIVPMVVAGETLGAITLVSAGSGRRFGPGDLDLAEDLAHRAALAINAARLYREAQEAIRGRDELLAVASHDLRNPLAAIKGRAQLLRRRLVAEESGLVSHLDQIEASADQIDRLVAELIDIAALQSGRSLELRRTPTDLVALVERLIRSFDGVTRGHVLRLETDVHGVVGEWDADRLGRAVGNLIANAVKYSPDGGDIVVRVSQEQDAQGAWAVVRVVDHGIGIPESEVPRVFGRYFRASNVGDISGHGIGLAGARQIVEQHGGQIDVASQLGAGSCFSIRLPLPGGSSFSATDVGG